MSRVSDQPQRELALDPLQSFCVTAPAGSGKTELLIQRFLTVLARVEQPEQVLAITFTRKAAAEMRARIVTALESATGDQPTDEHRTQTWRLAKQVLATGSNKDWQILEMPSRLNIRTIDSWSAYLTRQMPVLSSFGGSVSPVDSAAVYYRSAVRALLALLERGHWIAGDLSTVLLHFDNNWQQLEELLIRMLARREQWLMHLGSGIEPADVEQVLQHSVDQLVVDQLSALSEALGGRSHELFDCLNYSLENRDLPTLAELPSASPADLEHWLKLCDMLLTGGGSWRKKVDKRQGFPADGEEAKARKQTLYELVGELSQQTGLQQQLLLVQFLPLPGAEAETWDVLMSLARLLPVAAAQLSVVFQQEGVVDHSQIAMAARAALGDDEHITNLAQKLDYQLKHILLDEFQDTSVTQFDLLRRLTRNWAEDNAENPGNPNTLFVVGDGMQSIYGFRDADVSLFVQLKTDGINGVALQDLELSTNFRSDAGLVNWVSGAFRAAFPLQDDVQLGAVAFTASQPYKDAVQELPVNMLAAYGEDRTTAELSEAHAITQVIEQGMVDDGCESIAVLVRTRRHLYQLIDQLKQRQIPWQAQEIDTLAESPVVIDLLNLCKALHNFADDAAWLALLRAPWCGLTLEELLSVLGQRGEVSVWETLQHAEGVAALTRLRDVLSNAQSLREQLPLRTWIEDTWLNLGGPAIANSEQQLSDAGDFFDLLEEMDALDEVFSGWSLEERVARLFSKPSAGTAKLQLMTLHKSKGLEFDWVIIPGLGRAPASDRREILLWDDFVTAAGHRGLLLAADDRRQAGANSIYGWLGEQQKRKRDLETTRLMYVGCTRAVKRLFLSAVVESDDNTGEWKPPSSRTLLSRVWESFATEAQTLSPDPVAAAKPAARTFRRLAPTSSPVKAVVEPGTERNIPGTSRNQLAREVGNLVHLSLERLSSLADAELSSFNLSQWQAWWEHYLARRIPIAERDTALERVQQSVANILQDDRGRWLLSNQREEAVSEFCLSRIGDDGRLRELIVDRSFVDEGTRWIIDYKSGTPAQGESVEAFLDYQQAQYKSQLMSYCEALMGMDGKPTKMALYFTALPLWHECDY